MKNSSMLSNLPPPKNSDSQKWWAMLGIALGVVMFTLDGSIINIALPTLVKRLNTNFATVQWVAVSYLLVVTSLVLGAARLGDIFGKKLLYLWGLILFTIASLLCGLAPNIEWLIAFRAFQGLSAVFIAALAFAIITEVFPPSERGRALGSIAAAASLGIALGPTVGGLLIGIAGWRWIFLVNVPIGVFASSIVVRFVPASANTGTKQRFDGLGSAIATVSLLCFCLGMTQVQVEGFTNIKTLALLAVAVVSLAIFLAFESRINQPLLDLTIFHDREFSLSLLTCFLAFITFSGVLFLVPFFLEIGLYYPIGRVGLLLTVCPLIMGIISPVSGVLSDRFGSRLMSLTGLFFMLGGCLLMSTFDTQLTDLDYIRGIAPFGLGLGIFQSPNNSAIMGSVPKERLGIASGLISLSRTLGQMLGFPLMGALFAGLTLSRAHLAANADVTAAPPEALVYGFQGSLRFAALLLCLAAALTVVVSIMERRSRKISQ